MSYDKKCCLKHTVSCTDFMDFSIHKLNIKHMHKYLTAWRKSKGIVKKLDEMKRLEKLVLRMQKTASIYSDVFSLFSSMNWT